MVASSFAVAGIEPVEPAAITGPSALAAFQPRGLGLDQQVAPRRRLDRAALGQDLRPCLARDLQEFERELPVFVEVVRHERIEPFPRHWRVVMSSIRRARSSASASAAAGVHDQRLVARRRREPFGPFQHELRKQHAPVQPAERRRQVERVGPAAPVAASAKASSSSSMSPIGTMRGSTAASLPERVEEDVAREPAGAPRRQIERRGAQRERIGGRRKSGHQLAVDERADQRRQERRRRRDGEDARGAGGIGAHAAL